MSLSNERDQIETFKCKYLGNEDLSAPARPLIGNRKPKYAFLKNLARGSPLKKNIFIRKTKSQIQRWLRSKYSNNNNI